MPDAEVKARLTIEQEGEPQIFRDAATAIGEARRSSPVHPVQRRHRLRPPPRPARSSDRQSPRSRHRRFPAHHHPAMITHLQNLAALLDRITEGANQAQEATQRLATTSTSSAVPSLQSLQSLMSSVSDQSTATAQSVTTTLADLHQQTDSAHTQITTRLDDLQQAVSNHANLWNKAVSELIDAVKIGAVPIQQLIALYGDAQIGGERLREYLRGLDFNHYRDQVREFIQGLQDGSVEIARVQDYLGKTQLLFAKQLADIIELFRKGSVTLKRVEEIVRDIKRAFPESEFSDLAQALYDALKKGG